MKKIDVTVIDLGIGNLLSIVRGLEHFGARVTVTNNVHTIAKSSHVVLPGDGAFKFAMQQINKQGIKNAIQNIYNSKTKLLGICIGMQIMFDQGFEFEKTEGLGLISGEVIPIPNRSTNGDKLSLPHMGWNGLVNTESYKNWDGTLLTNNREKDEVYFIHSFMAVPKKKSYQVANCIYGGHRITAVIKKDNITGCQFHPEKSGTAGLKIIKEFIKS